MTIYLNTQATSAAGAADNLASETSASNGGSASLMPEPVDAVLLGNDMIAQLSAMMAKSFRQDRTQSKKLAHLQDQIEAREAQKRVAEMKAKARAIRNEAIISGVSQMAAGAIQVYGTARSLGELRAEQAATSKARLPALSEARRSAFEQTAKQHEGFGRAWTSASEGVAQMTEGAGTLLATGSKAAQADHDANAAEHEQRARTAERAAEELRKDADDAKRMLDKVCEFLAAARQARQDSMNATIRRG